MQRPWSINLLSRSGGIYLDIDFFPCMCFNVLTVGWGVCGAISLGSRRDGKGYTHLQRCASALRVGEEGGSVAAVTADQPGM